jgi:histidyl-tRNA synthetase
MLYKRIPGTRDILPQEISMWQFIESSCKDIFSLYNFREIRPPLLEDAALFNRSLGDATEVVQKQMFLIQNKEDTYALRPEATASICRAYIENSLDKTEGLIKLYYNGPMFRFERPQKGRQRQFHQFGCELIGTREPAADIEIISLADALLKKLSISGYTIKLNSLGCSDDRKKLNELIKQKVQSRISELCEECQTRYERNIVRILDCKNPQCQGIIASLQINHDHLCGDCLGHFTTVRSGLDKLGISFLTEPLLVRGLDYYTRTVFEITQQDLGAQDAIGAGGRYDALVKDLGGPDAGAIGFAFGVERIILAINNGASAIGDLLNTRSLVYVLAWEIMQKHRLFISPIN